MEQDRHTRKIIIKDITKRNVLSTIPQLVAQYDVPYPFMFSSNRLLLNKHVPPPPPPPMVSAT